MNECRFPERFEDGSNVVFKSQNKARRKLSGSAGVPGLKHRFSRTDAPEINHPLKEKPGYSFNLAFVFPLNLSLRHMPRHPPKHCARRLDDPAIHVGFAVSFLRDF